MLNDTLRVTVRSRDVDLALLQSFTSSIRNSSGRFNAQLDLAGPESNAVIVGTVAITDASASLPTLGIVLRQFNANIEAARDTVAFKRFSVLSGDQNDSRLTLEGLIARPLHDDRSFDLTFTARNFRAIGSKKLAELVVSTSPPLRLVGSWKGASTLTGAVVVNRGVIYMPPSSDKQLITLEPDDLAGLDTAAVARLQLLPKPPPDIVRNLVVDNVTLQMGPDVWLRSAESREMNVKLGGALSVTTGGRARDGTPQLALNGELRTERGTYLLNLASVVARTFSIENGNLRFYDDPELNPALDISAVYVAPQVSVTYGGRNDVRIRVRIRGTLSQPTLSLESADSLALSASDLISYLLVGAPSFDIAGGRNSYTSQLSSVALTSFANLGASRLVGRFIDYVQVQTAAEKFQIANLTQSSLLTGAALGLGKQLNDKTFLALNAGVCQFFKGSSQLDPITLAQNIGVKLEYQIRPQLGIAASSEPSLSALFCGQARGFTTSVRQYGFDLFRTFRW
jgi:translocation and assembly module TamB